MKKVFERYMELIIEASNSAEEHLFECITCGERLADLEQNKIDRRINDIIHQAIADPTFSTCSGWLEIRRPVTKFEAFLTDDDIREILTVEFKRINLKDYRAWESYFHVIRQNSLRTIPVS